jgi:hypothetical protein
MGCCWLSREHVHALSSLYLHLCTLCRPFRSMLLHYTPMYVNRMLCLYNIYNFQQRISWLSHRWRTQRNAISNVNCRIQWIIESLNAPCAPWYSEEHACLSVINISNLLLLSGFGCGGFCWRLTCSAPLKCISRTNLVHWCDNYLRRWMWGGSSAF